MNALTMVGIGGLGCPALMGILSGWPVDRELRIRLIDPDVIQLSNLNRQILFSETDLGSAKTIVAATRARELFDCKHVSFEPIQEALNETNIQRLLADSQCVIDGTDSARTKLLLNDFCVKQRLPLVYGGATGYEGVSLLVRPGGACLRCVFGEFLSEEIAELEGGCRAQGIVGAVVGMVGLQQAESALKLLLQPGDCLEPAQLYRFSLKGARSKTSPVLPTADCPNGCAAVRSDRKRLDLTHLHCPETFLYTKLTLEKLPRNTELEILFNNQLSAKNVCQSIVEEGQLVLEECRVLGDDRYQTTIAKVI